MAEGNENKKFQLKESINTYSGILAIISFVFGVISFIHWHCQNFWHLPVIFYILAVLLCSLIGGIAMFAAFETDCMVKGSSKVLLGVLFLPVIWFVFELKKSMDYASDFSQMLNSIIEAMTGNAVLQTIALYIWLVLTALAALQYISQFTATGSSVDRASIAIPAKVFSFIRRTTLLFSALLTIIPILVVGKVLSTSDNDLKSLLGKISYSNWNIWWNVAAIFSLSFAFYCACLYFKKKEKESKSHTSA